MKSFEEYILDNTTYLYESKSEGAALEGYIIDQWNSPGNKKVAFTNPTIDKDAAVKIVNFLKKQGLRGTASKLQITDSLSPEWAKFFTKGVKASTRTPKTDIMIGENRISCKMGDAQLMSGGPSESKATFYAAYASVEGLVFSVEQACTKEFEPLKNMIEKLGNPKNIQGDTYKIKGNSSTLKDKKGKPGSGEINKSYKAFKEGRATEQQKIVRQMDKTNNKVKTQLKNLFKNEDFAVAFVREAITGEFKFGENAVSCAKKVLCTNFEGNDSKLLLATNTNFLEDMVKKSQITCRFKSGRVKNGRNIWQVVSITTGKAKELEEECYKFSYGKVLTEGALDWIQKKWSEFKSFVSGVFDDAMKWIKESTQNLFEFFGLEPEVTFNNNINWA